MRVTKSFHETKVEFERVFLNVFYRHENVSARAVLKVAGLKFHTKLAERVIKPRKCSCDGIVKSPSVPVLEEKLLNFNFPCCIAVTLCPQHFVFIFLSFVTSSSFFLSSRSASDVAFVGALQLREK